MNPAPERRRSTRRQAAERTRVIRIRPGHVGLIVDLSAGGMLVETDRGLAPGASVELQMEVDARRCVVRGRVLRCAIAQLHASGVRYRSAIAFEHHAATSVHAHGYPVPAADDGDDRAERAEATHGPL
jgi:hypothetical protein